MQEHSLQAALSQGAAELEIAILVVARYRKSEVGEMHANLVRAPRQKLGRKQRVSAKSALPPEHGLSFSPGPVDADTPLAFARHLFLQRQVDPAFVVLPLALDQRQIALAHPSLAQ